MCWRLGNCLYFFKIFLSSMLEGMSCSISPSKLSEATLSLVTLSLNYRWNRILSDRAPPFCCGHRPSIPSTHKSNRLLTESPPSVVDYILCAINRWGQHNRHCIDFLASAFKVDWRPQRELITLFSMALALTNAVKRRSQLKPLVIGVSFNHPHIVVPCISLINSLTFLYSLDSVIQFRFRVSALPSIWGHAINGSWLFHGTSSFTVKSRSKVQHFGCDHIQHTGFQVWLRLLYFCIVHQFLSTGVFPSFA